MTNSRRSFLKNTAITASVLPFSYSIMQAGSSAQNMENLDISIFSKHLQFLDYKETGAMAAELGFDGVDLTVRPKGHVLPENVTTDLPAAIQDIQENGSSCKMITTSIESVENSYDVDIIRTAAAEGVTYYRTHWYKYLNNMSMVEALKKYQDEIHNLSELNKEHDIIGCYQNHAGTKVGASYWEVHRIIEKADPKYFGTQYDIRHATVDSGYSWTNGLSLLKDQIKVIVLKDFKWGKVDNEWKAVNVPIGEGMVDFTKYFKLLKSYKLSPPVTLHLEYPLGGAEKGKFEISVDKKVIYNAMKKDLKTIRNLWKQA